MSSDAPMTTDGQRLYVSVKDYEEEIVIPALGDQADDYDTHAIASAMLSHHEETDSDGMALIEHTGLLEQDDVDFWEVVAEHDVLGAATSAADEVRRLESLLDEARGREVAAALAAWDAGLTKYRIAQATGRSEAAVGRWVNKNRPRP